MLSTDIRTKFFLLKDDATRVALPEKVDAIICEMIATGLIEELQIPTMNNILKYAKRHVRVLLNYLENYVDLVFNNDTFHNHKLKIVRYEFPDIRCTKSTPFSNKHLYSRIDFSRINMNNKINKGIVMTIDRDGWINGLRISSKSIFYDGSTLDGTSAYSYPVIFPIEDIRVKKGDRFQVCLSYRMCGGLQNFKYDISQK